MKLRFLLDTHILIHWLVDPRRLSPEQKRCLGEASSREEDLAISAATLLELAILFSSGRARYIKTDLSKLIASLEDFPQLQILPITVEVASEMIALGGTANWDPGDRTIVATARVNGLSLLTSDQRIIESRLVPVIG